MKCAACGLNIVQKSANFCSNCGHKLSTQPPNKEDAEDQPKSLVEDLGAKAEKSGTRKNDMPVDNKPPQRRQQNDNSISDTKKKKRKRKKNKKKKGQQQSISDQSLLSVGDKREKEDSSECESSESPTSNMFESLESQSCSLSLSQNAAFSEDAQDIQEQKTLGKAEESATSQSGGNASDPKDGNETMETDTNPSANQQEQSGDRKDTSQPGSNKGTKKMSPKDLEANKNDPKKKAPVSKKQSAQDENVNTDPNANQTEVTKSESLDSQSKSLPSSQAAASLKDANNIQGKKAPAKDEESAKPKTDGSAFDDKDSNETTEMDTDQSANQQQQSGDSKGAASQQDSNKGSKKMSPKDQEANKKDPKKKAPVPKKQSAQDENANTDPNDNQTEVTKSESLDSQSKSLPSSQTAASLKDANNIEGQKTTAKDEESAKPKTEGTTSDPKDSNETSEMDTDQSANQQQQSGDSKGAASQQDSNKGTKKTSPKDQEANKKDPKKRAPVSNKSSAQDQNANTDPNANQSEVTKQKGKHQQEQKLKQSESSGQKSVTDSSTSAMADNEGSSVDPVVASEVQQSSSTQDKTSGGNKEHKENTNEKKKLSDPSPKIIPAKDRLTIYFHAILSKHFKFDPKKDQIVIRAGSCLGNWKENTAELHLQKDLGEHGFLVEGCLVTTKQEAMSRSIPYKYVVCREKKVAFEFIYKKSSNTHINRCLFVKPHLINDSGDWHQYDDIICTQPSKIERFKDFFWREQTTNVIEGKKIAGNIMLETIFDLLGSWTETNLKSFLIQLKQFFQVYGNPYVYEEKAMKWSSLDYGENDVKLLLTEFMLKHIQRHIQDPLRAAVIMLHLWREYELKLSNTELHQLCTSLCLPKLEKDVFVEYWNKFYQDVSPLKSLPENLVHLINTVKKEGMPRWIVVLPLLHLLKGLTKPFEAPPTGTYKYLVSWAGLQGLDVGTAKDMNSQNRRELVNAVKNQSHLLDVDSFLARSCLYLMSLDDLEYCSSNINAELLDMLCAFINKTPQAITASNMKEVLALLSHIQGNLMDGKYRYFTQAYRSQCLVNALTLLEKICKGVKPASYTQNFPDIPVACMNLVASVSDFAQCNKAEDTAEGDREQFYSVLKCALKLMRDWISLSYRANLLSSSYILWPGKKATEEEIEMWNNTISIGFKDEDFTNEWKQTFTNDFEGKFKQESALDQIEFYCNTIEELSASRPRIASIIEKCALEAVTSLCQKKSEGKLFERIKINWKFGKLISTIIQKSWPINDLGKYEEDEQVVLQHLLSWPAVKDIFQLHGADEKLISQLSQDAQDKLAVAISSFTAINDQLIRGDIQIKLLNVILETKSTYLELLKIDCLAENQSYKNISEMRRLLLCREKELKAVYHEKQLVDVVLKMCHRLEEHITVDIEDLERKQQTNIEVSQLNHFMMVHQLGQTPCPEDCFVTLFSLTDEIRKMAEVLHKLEQSYVFKMFWGKQAKLLAAEEMEGDPDHRSVVDILATPEQIYDDIFLASFGKFKDIYTRLKNGSIRLEEVNQIFSVFKGKYQELAQDLEFMCTVDNSTDYDWITTRVRQIEQYHELHLAVASAKIIMTVKEVLCLRGDFTVLETLTRVSHADFQKEELSSIDNDLMEAKIALVDITEPRKQCLYELGCRERFVKWVKDALEDINELKVFVDLASISAGENDMDVDRVACFHDAILGYSSMLYELKPDSGFSAFKEVIKKLWRALENDINLPKKLRDSARHIEWLKTVKESHGSVELSSLSLATAINHKGIYLISAQGVKKLTLDTALKLQIPEESDGINQMRCYSLEDLRELQNKLMLMSGKEDQGQKEVDHFVEVFASVQRLAVAFIALFDAGSPLFRHWEAQINGCVNSQGPKIMMEFNLSNVPTIILDGNVVDQLPELCRKIEKCLNYWMDFVREQRSKHYYLNYFTAEQIVYLCGRLTQQKVTNLEDQVLMMLSFIKPNCTPSDLRQVWDLLQYEILNKGQEEKMDMEFQSSVDDSSFDHIWNDYMKDMKSFLPSVLDLESLGRLLKLLANKDDCTEEREEDTSDKGAGCFIKRELPKGLTTGNPNLIICPHNEVLTSCISIYMTSTDMPLPTYDEVLLCNSSTSYEEVENFLRRCLSEGYRGHKIYSLLYGDLLTYDVSSKLEIFFQSMKLRCRKDYRLVIICSSEKEHAYLPSAFSQYRLHLVPQEPLLRVQQYLQKHYTVPTNAYSAAAVFKGRQCVGVISSKRAGVGKSLYIRRLFKKLKSSTKRATACKCIRLIEPTVDENVIIQSLLETLERKSLTMYHFDVTSSVCKGLHEFLFKLLFLRYLVDSEGKMWKCNDQQLYVIEMLQPTVKSTRNVSHQSEKFVRSTFTDMFPNIFCRPPKEVLMLEMRKQEDPSVLNNGDPLMDDDEFKSEAFQRPFQYLMRFHNHIDLDGFTYQGIEGSHVECLQMFLMNCGIMDPSWAELRNFAWFLNLQLKDCETSVFCDSAITGETLGGFKTFVVDFMILMAKDFATPSLSISDQSPGRLQMDLSGIRDEDLAPFLIRKRWETEPHPYIFFNDDHVSMTFIGFHLQPNGQNHVDAIDPFSGRLIKKNVMSKTLYDGLKLQRVPFNIDFDKLPRGEKIERICNVLGVQWPLDPDETYELTTDNILKMLAIHMRFRCGIPVIIMGETGCGKTRLIKFMCELRRIGVATENMKLVKVHGGTTAEMIYSKVREAEDIASINKLDYAFDSVLFFDEANTTEAISSIKEVLCDKTVKGKCLKPNSGLQIIAACNPYRKHTDEMIHKLESAGLGYRVRAEETDEKLGSIPLRQLVYRVQALPPSMIPLVWDFGQLSDQTEKMYIQQIVQRVVENQMINHQYIGWITDVLSVSQKYLRTKKDECSFVSLRDVERCMQAFVWFYENHDMFFAELRKFKNGQNDEMTDAHPSVNEAKDPILWSLIMATAVCYQACLEKKDKYRQIICHFLPSHCNARGVAQEISLMQDLLLSGVPMGDTIARNGALKENVFMMVLCIELRIPLFLVGKPGSSKSLSKTLVADAMQGQAAPFDLYKKLKQIHLVSFQCSPHSTPEGIINTFKQCGRFQEGKNLNEYISVVVLDEIGLAEDSPKMPLKTLHPLLEEGCIDDEPLPHKKVGFIGISNWALDPAKMNRGIFVCRGDPDEKELVESAIGICSSDPMVLEKVSEFFQPFAQSYLRICRKTCKRFFGLRDYYSLIKMIFSMAKASQKKPTAEEIAMAVLRNFSGKVDVEAVKVFTERLSIKPNIENINAIEFVRENLEAAGQEEECRYLLVLTKNYAALQILQQTFFSESSQPEIIFGSSFPRDQEYMQICRNINRVKICMETGKIVVLLNLQNLYESLYDALNQYYVSLGGQKYVDLGLGTHRVKCRVHPHFRLIVIEERDVVYKEFPIPLINRLEKHYLDTNTVLGTEQKRNVKELEKWVEIFVSLVSQNTGHVQTYKYQPADVFIGYHADTCASLILQVTEKQEDNSEIEEAERKMLDEAKLLLLKCATPDSVVRLGCTGLSKVEIESLTRIYFEELNNTCLADYILAHTRKEFKCRSSFTEVTTFSRLLTACDLELLEQVLQSVQLLSLQQFDTELSFLKKIRNFLTNEKRADASESYFKILIIQCDFDEAPHSANLIASAKYSSINEINKITQKNEGCNAFVYFITRLPRIEGGTSYIGFHGGPWRSVHIDDLRRSKDISDVKTLQNMTISQMFDLNQTEAMEVNDIYSEHEPQEGQLEENASSHAVDTTALLRSCVQNAVSMLRDQMDTGLRSTQRVEILLTLMNDNDTMEGKFLQLVKRHLHTLLGTFDCTTFASIGNNWVFNEASNIEALQEGGTFMQTLWRRIQAVIVPLLAHLVSIIDRDQNLNLLLDEACDDSVKRLWLDIFSDDKLLEISHQKHDHPNVNSSETRTILVQSYIGQNKNMSCSMPFSWRIRDYLEELWVHALHHEGQTQKEFDDFFLKTPLGRYIARADPEMQAEFFQRYLQDFTAMTMNTSCQEDLQLLSCALNCCVNELRLQLKDTKRVASLPWVHAAYHEFKNRLQNLSRMICLEAQVTRDLLGNQHTRDGVELVLDVYAAFACVEYLEPRFLDTTAQRQIWLRQVKKLQVPIELACSADSVKKYGERCKTLASRVQAGWNRIFSLSLFVEHLLFGIEELNKKLAPLVLQSTRKLGQVLEKNPDLKTQESFETVISLLRSCKEGAVECSFRFGLTLCLVCMGDPQDALCLPCEHMYCMACIKQWLNLGQMFCPLCMQPVADDFPLVPSEDTRNLINQHAQFIKQCNAFFIDLVSSMCFKDDSPPCSEVILHLLSFVMTEANFTPIMKADRRQLRTKVLSPFDDCIDKNPVVRSVMLKLLLKYSFEDVKDYLQQHLRAVEQSNLLEEMDKTELYCLYINCLEDSMFERSQFRSTADEQTCLQQESVFVDHYLQSQRPFSEMATVEYLQQLARVRMNLDMTARLIAKKRHTGSKEGSRSGISTFLTSVKNLCSHSGNDWYRVYLIRKICCQQGVEVVLKLAKEKEIHWLFPKEVLQKLTQNEDSILVDHYLVYGENYKMIRDVVVKGVLEGKVDKLDEACEDCKCTPQWKTIYLLLALYREVTTLYRDTNTAFHPKPELLDSLVKYIQASRILASPAVKDFAQSLVKNQLQPLVTVQGASGVHSVLADLTIHLAVVLLCSNQPFLAPLQHLAGNPANMQKAFLPTMPEDMLAVAQKALGSLTWYICPNGHPCTIGECGQPMQTSRCVDCGANIGGVGHRPVMGFQHLQIQGDRTQTGHILGDPQRRDSPDMSDTKNISPVPFSIIRMLTHMAMLLGCRTNPQAIETIINPRVKDTGAFLHAHLKKDIDCLIRCLGKGTDDTISSVHLLISSLLEAHQQKWPAPYDQVLSTKETRNGWESEMSNAIITPLLKQLDRQLKEANVIIRADSRISSNPVMKLVFGDPRLFLASLPPRSLIHSPAVWSCREKVSLLSLAHVVEQNDGKDTLPVLWRFLQREAEIRLVKHLPDILTLLRDLVKKFQNISELRFRTIDEFLANERAVTLKSWYQKHIDLFLKTWNQLRVSLATNGEIKIPAEFCQRDMSVTSDFKVLLPRRQGPGLCSTALISYLIALHNDMVYCVDKNTGEDTSYKVSPADLTDLHVIHYELERDVMPLILANTQYSMEKGQETIHEYDLPKIQQQLISHFLLGKPLITLTGIPTLVNRHDRNYEIILKDVSAKIKQEALQTLTLFAVAAELNSYSDVCEALSTLEVALGFLAMTGGEPQMQLSCFLEEVLQMGNQMAQHILKVLSMCCLKHCVAMWQLLASLKSENMLRLKRDPFQVAEVYKKHLSENERRLLTSFFSRNSANLFILEMHEFLVLVLKTPNAPETYRPDWGLKDTLVSYLERKDVDVPPEVEEHFPEEITLAHYVESWKFIVEMKQDHGPRQ
ncbi:E3 ubiquitin-protein ligase rnf213-alpha [Gouania willdenowi]|uniref:E3 ubiquitin-protein ligase rnf213-alpha n=1 Tax=Gouania willdenowi TaxID=441366 RepID=UPI001055C4A6|nr:E3 ubiquitin-protein ligase RNF213 [Gouania willdenowi]XP_028310204.1 E3 ubiquitin-protein ligase RNF213 [Gouania willdenowi]